MNDKLMTISESEMAKVKDGVLNIDQLNLLFAKTPDVHKYERPAKGGGKWTYVTGTYVKKKLNVMFAFDWDFEVIKHEVSIPFKQVVVEGKLTCRSNGKTIIRMQFGRQDIKFRRQTDEQVRLGDDLIPLDLGNDLKGATTDALKKCASELGIASDVYAPNEFKAIRIVEDIEARPLDELLNLVKHIENIDELQLLWGGLTKEEQGMVSEAVALKNAEFKTQKA